MYVISHLKTKHNGDDVDEVDQKSPYQQFLSKQPKHIKEITI